MNTVTIDPSKPEEILAAIRAAMRRDPYKIIFTQPAPEFEMQAREAGIVVEVQPSALQ